MKIQFLVLVIMLVSASFNSCKNSFISEEVNYLRTENNILQHEDGTISLKVDNADCYHDMKNPSSNTAEWNVVISKSGRFNVWLSSATMDTVNLRYQNSVMLSILDNRLESKPLCDKVFRNSNEVSYPYFRTDSFMGSLYIQDTGLFNIQVISDKIIPSSNNNESSSAPENTKLLSVVLTPVIK